MGLPNNTDLLKRRLPTGEKNLITDLDGIRVGHATLHQGDIHTGVTIVSPRKNIYPNPLPAACHVINGFSKPIGFIQVDELGTIESPIGLTNTFAIGTLADGLIKRVVKEQSDVNQQIGSFNSVVMECNDSYLSDMKSFPVLPEHVTAAFDDLSIVFLEGDVGAGSGMVCYGLKGGIGSSSRIIDIKGKTYTLGCLVLTNFGQPDDLILRDRLDLPANYLSKDQTGSVVIVLASDAPLDHRQLKRISRRAQSGLARTGAYVSHGSGEIVLAFSTDRSSDRLIDPDLDRLFLATVEAVEESVLSSLWHANSVVGYHNRQVLALKDVLTP